MKSYTITVNGNVYDVTVEEKGETASAPKASAPAKKTVKKAAGKKGSVVIKAEATGKVFRVNAKEGMEVKKGQPLLILEIMKMETPITAPQDGVVASVEVVEGQQVETGNVLITLD